jgi:kynureninase
LESGKSFCVRWADSEFFVSFFIPKANPAQESGPEAVYLCGHSLGLQPKSVRSYMEEELKKWELMGVRGLLFVILLSRFSVADMRLVLCAWIGHVQGKHPWWLIDEIVKEDSAKLVGAKPEEVIVMNSLTINLHVMVCAIPVC